LSGFYHKNTDSGDLIPNRHSIDYNLKISKYKTKNKVIMNSSYFPFIPKYMDETLN